MKSEKKLTYKVPRVEAQDLQLGLSVLTSSPTGEAYDEQVRYVDDFDE